jgi:two-component system NtrC family sensor kinase
MQGKGEIVVAAREWTERGGIHLSVTDNGCGIGRENLDKIFEPFFSTKGDRGNGLGLAAVRSIIQEHGGIVTVDTEVGQGATFNVYLPSANRAKNAGIERSHSTVPPFHDWSES